MLAAASQEHDLLDTYIPLSREMSEIPEGGLRVSYASVSHWKPCSLAACRINVPTFYISLRSIALSEIDKRAHSSRGRTSEGRNAFA